MAKLAPNLSGSAQPAWLNSPPHLWRPGTLNRDLLLREADALSSTEGFETICKIFGGNLLAAYDSSWELNRTIRKAVRFALIVFILYLHRHRGRGEAGVTYGRIREIFGQGSSTGVMATPTRIKAMLGQMHKMGQLQRVDAGGDKRLRIYEPTEKLIEPVRIWLRAFLNAVECATPLVQPVEKLLAAPNFIQELFSYNALAYMHDRFVLYEPFPEIHTIMSRENGYIALREILRTWEYADGAWRAQAPFLALERRYRMARGTVRNLLTEAEKRGWLRVAGRGGREIILSDEFAALCRRWVGLEFVWMAGLANAAGVRVMAERHREKEMPA